MKTISSITLLVVLLFVSILNKVEATTPTTLLCLVNKERIRARVRPLALDVRLIKSAQLHTNYMARAGNLTHDDEDGSLGKRIDNVGFDWRAAGENIAYGFYSEDEVGVMKAWMKSRGHRANILNRRFTHFGSGFLEKYWTQNFAESADGYPPNVPICPEALFNSLQIDE